MLWLYKLLGSLVTPPGLFIFILFLILLAIYNNWRKLAKFFTTLLFMGLYFMSITPGAELLLMPLESWYPPLDYVNIKANSYSADYIVVLGGGVIDHSPEYAGATVLTTDPLKRVDYAIDLHQRLGLPIIFSGGTSDKPGHGLSEGDASKQYCLKRGLDPKMLLVESSSRTTEQNISEIKRLFAPKQVILVTSAFHMLRANTIFNYNGIKTIPAPTDYKSKGAGYELLDFYPLSYNLSISSLAFKEYVGLLFYTLKSLLN